MNGDEERASQYNRTARAKAPTEPAASIDSISSRTIPPKPSTANRPPTQSNPWPRLSALLSGTFHRVSNTTATPSGTLMKNTDLHEPCSTNHPPSKRPIAAVIDVNPAHVTIG